MRTGIDFVENLVRRVRGARSRDAAMDIARALLEEWRAPLLERLEQTDARHAANHAAVLERVSRCDAESAEIRSEIARLKSLYLELQAANEDCVRQLREAIDRADRGDEWKRSAEPGYESWEL